MSGRRRVVLVLLLMLAAWAAGTYRETRSDPSGWCVHFQHVMLCNAQAATDYIFAAH